jgi:hypothetical protein
MSGMWRGYPVQIDTRGFIVKTWLAFFIFTKPQKGIKIVSGGYQYRLHLFPKTGSLVKPPQLD